MNISPNSPKDDDAVLGGQDLAPVGSVIMGGLEGLRQRLAADNCERRIVALADALNYGEAGIDLLIEAMNDAVLAVRATAYKYLQQIVSAKSEQKSVRGIPKWWQQLEGTFVSDKVQRAIAKGIPFRKGDRLYCVYISAFDYDDNYFTLLDSIEAYKQHNFHYDEQLHLVSRYLFREQAERVAEDLHQIILADGSFADFNQRYQLNLDPRVYAFITDKAKDLTQFYRNEQQSIAHWCMEHEINIELDEYLVNDGITDWWWDAQEAVLEKLQSQPNYRLLDEFRELIGIGKFAFVHEEMVSENSYLKITGTL